MTFQAYLDSIFAKTGKKPDDFRRLATARGFVAKGKLTAKASEVVTWLHAEFGLGRGHAMAIVALLQGSKREGD